MPPAARSRPGTRPSRVAGGSPACSSEPRVVVIPATSSRSFTRTGRPATRPTRAAPRPDRVPPRPGPVDLGGLRERLVRPQGDDGTQVAVAGLDQPQGALDQ